MKKITFLIFLCAFLLLRPYNFSTTGLMYTGDDESYFAHSSALAFGTFPSYTREYWSVGEAIPAHTIGAGVMAAPFVFLFSQLDRVSGNTIIERRTRENIPGSWSQFGFVVSTSVYFWLACLFLYLAARMHVNPQPASWAVVGMVLAQGAPLFVFRRPIFTHTYELMLMAVLVWMLCRVVNNRATFGRGSICAVGIVCGLLVLTRMDDLFFVIAFPVLFVSHLEAGIYKKLLALFSMFFLIALLVLIFKIWPETLVGHYSFNAVSSLGRTPSISSYIHRTWHILTGPDWGLIYTAPFLLLASVYLYTADNKDLSTLRWLGALLLVKLLIVIQWNTQGGWYGYRYLVFCAMALLTVPFALFLDRLILHSPPWRRAILLLIAVPPVLSMLLFEGNSTGLTVSHVEQYFGVAGWGNNFYQWEVWKALLFSPIEALIALGKGGVLYSVYLLCNAFSMNAMLPSIALEKYPLFQWATAARTLIIYLVPFILYAAWRYFQPNADGAGTDGFQAPEHVQKKLKRFENAL